MKPALLVIFFLAFTINERVSGGVIELDNLANKIADLLPFLVFRE